MSDEVIDLHRQGEVWVLRMVQGENRFNWASVRALHAALDQIEATPGPAALVTTGAGKFYSNGLDLDWLLSAGPEGEGFLPEVHRLLGRVLGLDMVTVAAINGHAFAGGAMLATAHDYRVMRADRGFWCLPEVDLGLPLTPGMYAVVAAHLPRPALHHSALSGHRYGGEEALTAGIVDEVADEGEVLDRAVARAAELAGKSREVIAEHKRLLYGDAMAACGVHREPLLPPDPGAAGSG